MNHRALTHTDIIRTTADYFSITVDEILTHDQHQPLATYRKIAMYLCRNHLYASYPTIGGWFDRHHTTVMFAVRSIEQSVGRVGGASTRKHIEHIETLLTANVDRRTTMVSVGNGMVFV